MFTLHMVICDIIHTLIFKLSTTIIYPRKFFITRCSRFSGVSASEFMKEKYYRNSDIVAINNDISFKYCITLLWYSAKTEDTFISFFIYLWKLHFFGAKAIIFMDIYEYLIFIHNALPNIISLPVHTLPQLHSAYRHVWFQQSHIYYYQL